MRRTLHLALHGRVVADLAEPRTNKFTLTYRPEATDDDTVSVRLPTDPDRYPPAAVGPLVAGLVPSLDRREELAEEHETPAHLAFRFLEILGRDLPGGIVCVATESALPADEVAVSARPLGEDDLSDEVAVVMHENEPAIPDDGVPSTHFLRVEDPILPGSAAAEVFTLRLATNAGLPAAPAELIDVFGRPAALISRCDRYVTDAGLVGRRHLEHFGQVCAIDTLAFDEAIYEEQDGPGFLDLAEAIHEILPGPLDGLRVLAQLMIFHAVIGNTNAHAGSYTLLLPERAIGPIDTAIPAELYTELETEEGLLELDHRLAMSINGFWKTDALDHEDFVVEAASWPGLSREAAIVEIDGVLDRLSDAVNATIAEVSEAHNGLSSMVISRIDHFRSPGSDGRSD